MLNLTPVRPHTTLPAGDLVQTPARDINHDRLILKPRYPAGECIQPDEHGGTGGGFARTAQAKGNDQRCQVDATAEAYRRIGQRHEE